MSLEPGTRQVPDPGTRVLVRHTVSSFNMPVANIIHSITFTVALDYCECHDFELPTVKYEFSSTNETIWFSRFLIICDFSFFFHLYYLHFYSAAMLALQALY